MNTGLFFSDKFQEFDLGPSHPMNKNRMISTWKLFQEIGTKETTIYSPQPAKESDIEQIHAIDYVDEVKRLAKESLKSKDLY